MPRKKFQISHLIAERLRLGETKGMCGIAGFTHLGAGVDPGRIAAATGTITHRGPDQQGTWEDGDVSLGAVRLKIIDLAGGKQPMQSGPVTIVFNGEVYNYRELRSEMGGEFRTNSDTEVVLEAYRRWGSASFVKLRGMFAFAIWDAERQELFLVRDRLGIKPLYYHEAGENLYFGSELKVLFAFDEVPRTLDSTGLSYFLSLNYIPQPYTMAAGIRKVQPGTFLRWSKGRYTAETYWKLALRPEKMSLGAAKEELHELMQKSLDEHLISDVPLGVWASGGVDSTAVLHYAAQKVSKLKTFSVSFAGRSFDESRWFREVSQVYQTEHHEFDVNPESGLVEAIEEIATYSDEPSADAGALPVWFLSKMTRRQVTVALSGEGADELFAGYQTYIADALARRMHVAPGFVRKAAWGLAKLLPPSDEKIGWDYKVQRFFAGTLLPPDEAHFSWNGSNSMEEKVALAPGMPHRRAGELCAGIEARPGTLNRYLWADQLYYLPDDILYKCDRMSMAHSLEVRPPFLDNRIVEFAARLPENWKLHGGTTKYVLRELLRDKIPPSVLARPKQGFDIPAHHWFRTVLKPLLLDTVNERAVRETGIFSWPAVEGLIERHMSRKQNAGYSLWGLLTLFLWMKRWKIQTTAGLSRPLPTAAATTN